MNTQPQQTQGHGKDKGNKAAATPAGGTTITPPPTETAIEVLDYDGDAGGGFELQTMADRKMPLIVVLQANSPTVAESKGKYHAGQFQNSVTGEVFDEITFVPAITDRCWLEYLPRAEDGSGGGFRGRHSYDSKIVAAAIAKNDGRAIGKVPLLSKDRTGKDEMHELVESFEVYSILYVGSDMTGFGVISFASTKIKAYKAWNTQLAHFAPKIGQRQFKTGEIPLFAHRVKMTTELDQRGKLSWWIPVLAPATGGDDLVKSLLPQSDVRYQAAKKLKEEVRKGLAKVAYESTQSDAPAGGAVDDDSIPF